MHNEFVSIVYSKTPKESYNAFVEKWTDCQARYVAYVRTQWGKNMDKWALGLCDTPLQGIHTNNFIESWHRNPKYHFLDDPRGSAPTNSFTPWSSTSYLTSAIS